MRSSRNILAIIGLMFIFSCQNDTIDPNPPGIPCKLIRINYYTVSPNGGLQEYSFSYTGDNITEVKSNVDRFVFFYDASNNIIRKEMYIIGDPVVKMQVDYTYDNQNRLIKKKKVGGGWIYYNSTQEYFYSNGNMTEIKFYGPNGTYLGNQIWTWVNNNPITRVVAMGSRNYSVNNFFDLTKENKLISIYKNFFQIVYEDEGSDDPYGLIIFLGKNLLIKEYVSASENDVYSYTFNNNGYIKDIYISENSSSPSLTMSFSYSCD
ncbi:MAG: hypothetical protein ABIP79_09750 [Chitinophagaceae bacterium]